MGTILSIVITFVFVALVIVGFGSIVKRNRFQQMTPDGDSVANRMLGHGPADEVYWVPWHTRLFRLLRRARRRSE